MALNPIKIVSLFLGLLLTPLYAAHSDYWTEFEREHKRTGISLINHIQTLSVIQDKESTYVRNRKKDALAYFLATGGQNGFKKEPPTASEYEILVKAVAVTTVLHSLENDRLPVLDLIQIRRRYGLRTEDDSTKSHLIQAQAIVGYTLTLMAYFKLVASVQQRYNLSPSTPKTGLPTMQNDFACRLSEVRIGGYLKPLRSLSPSISDNDLNKQFGEGATQSVIQSIVSMIEPSYPKILDAYRQDILGLFTGSLVTPQGSSTTPASSTRRIHTVILRNGATVARTNDGRITTNLFGGTMTGKSINFNGFLLDGGWTDDEFVTAMQRIGVVQVLYS